MSGPAQTPAATPAARKPPAKATAADLRAFIAAVFGRAGVSPAHAGTVADALVWANLRGVDTHGVTRIPRYVELIDLGEMNPAPAITVSRDLPGSVLIDADRGAGPVAMSFAAEKAAEKARFAGIGMALVKSTTHTAALGYYTQALARQGMAAIAISASWPNMAYHGARTAGVSTNPLSIAVPMGESEPLVLDMATGVVAMGKLVQAKKNGLPLEPGWALDRAGNPTTDANEAHIPLPMGGPKGAGLSLMIECLTSILVSNPLVSDWLEALPISKKHRQNAMIIAIDLSKFTDPAAFGREVARMAKDLAALPRSDEASPILMPGERGGRIAERRSREGIPVPPAIMKELHALAERLGVAMFQTSGS